jgi:hypothetical protein
VRQIPFRIALDDQAEPIPGIAKVRNDTYFMIA